MKNNMFYSKRFFCLEGIDGSGKTTQLQMLASALKERGYSVVSIREPGGSLISEKIRALLLDKSFKGLMSDKAELMLYNAARAQVIEEIILPALDAGNIVLADRFAFSTLAYQGYGRKLDLEMIKQLSSITCKNCFPEMTFILDIHPTEGKMRRNADGKIPDRLEAEADSFFLKVQNGYKQIHEDFKSCTMLLDAKTPKEILHETILNSVLEKLKSC